MFAVASALTGAIAAAAATGPAEATPYQATGFAQCPTSVNCIVKFQKVAAGKRLDLRFASCEVTGVRTEQNFAADVGNTRIYLETGTRHPIQENLLVPDEGSISYQSDSDTGYGNAYTAVSQPVFFSIAQGEKRSIVAWPTQSSPPFEQYIANLGCTVHGDLADASSPSPYQVTAHAQCPTGVNCVVKFPALAYALDVQFVSCQINSGNAANGRYYLQTVQDGETVAMPLAMPYRGGQTSGSTVYSAISQPLSFLVPAQQPLRIFGWPANNSHIDRLDCTVAGLPQ
jgi:hypothetical protein